jgi:hypothetical protein
MSVEGQSANPRAAAPGIVNERYEVGDRLTGGTFFETFRGRDVRTGRPVAIKVLRPEHARDDAFAARLLDEARSAANLQHPNIAQVFDAWRENGTLYLAVEWVRGINLRDRIRRVAPFPLAVGVDIMQACAEALDYAHEAGYVHGDIRPDNIIITPDGRVKVTDFGLAANVAAGGSAQLSALPQAVHYMAPEIAQGRPPDARSDIYGLGCIFFEMLSGSPPYDADAPLAIAVKHLNDPVPSLRKANPNIPITVDGIAAKCLQKNPMERYVTAKALLDDILQVQDALRNDRPLVWSPIAPRGEPAPVTEKTRRPLRAARPVRAAPVHEADSGPSVRLLLGVFGMALVMVGVFFAIILSLMKSPAEVRLPSDLIGLTQENAALRLTQLGLKPDIRQEYNDRVAAGKVYDTAPKPGTDMRSGKTVTLYVSRGSQPIPVPDVVGKELAVAREAIRAAGLTLGETREEFSENIDKGQVISQSPTSDTQAQKKATVDLVLSKGPSPIPDLGSTGDSGSTPPDADPGDDPGGADDSTPQNPQPPDPSLPTHDQEVKIHIPRGDGTRKVRIIVRNEDGTEQIAYEQDHFAGEDIAPIVTTHGAKGKCQIRVYLDGKLIDAEDV